MTRLGEVSGRGGIILNRVISVRIKTEWNCEYLELGVRPLDLDLAYDESRRGVKRRTAPAHDQLGDHGCGKLSNQLGEVYASGGGARRKCVTRMEQI